MIGKISRVEVNDGEKWKEEGGEKEMWEVYYYWY